jgi:glycosyltransferase involved in cell wall biosynthesis
MCRSIHPSDLTAAWEARRYLRRLGPFDIVHGHSSKGGAVARLAAIGSGAATFYTPHALVTMSPELVGLKRRFFSLAELALSKLTMRIIAVGAEEARFAVTAGLGESRVVMVPNGVGTLDLPPRHEVRRLCGVDPDDIAIGWVGRLVESKAPDVLLKSLAIAIKKAPRLRAVFVGDGPMRIALSELAARLGIAQRVSLLGERDARPILPAFDIFASSSRMEAMPYVVLEAMAAGLPIVATTTSGTELLVDPGVNGTIVPTDDCEALAAALVPFAADPVLAQRMGAASRQRVAQFTVEKMVERTLALYESCIHSEATDDEAQLAVDVE